MASIIQLFTNPAAWIQESAFSKVGDNQRRASMVSSVLDEDKGFMSNIIQQGQDRVEALQSQIGKPGEAIEKAREAIGSGLRDQIISGLDKIADRELPEVSEYKPAGRAAEWMNRLGAGLYAAGGGNPEDIYRNFRAKEDAKLARHQRQTELRAAAVEGRDADLMSALTQLHQRDVSSELSLAGMEQQAQQSLFGRAADAATHAMDLEAQQALTLQGAQATLEQQYQGHLDRMAEIDKGGQLDEAGRNQAAAHAMRSDLMSTAIQYGIDPSEMGPMINSVSANRFDLLTDRDKAQLEMMTDVSSARTNEEVRLAKMNAYTRLMGVRVHQRGFGGELLYDMNNQAITAPLNEKSAFEYLFGSVEAGQKAISNNDIEGRTDATKNFIESLGVPTDRTTLGPGGAQIGSTRAVGRQFGGMTHESAALSSEGLQSGDEIRRQTANLGPIWDQTAQLMIQENAGMGDIVYSLQQDGAQPEIIQHVMRLAMEHGLWDGQEDKDKINSLLAIPGQTQ